jgi:catechol 2,3-dioxygenase-like lactoylglutathione lyase family enzyme
MQSDNNDTPRRAHMIDYTSFLVTDFEKSITFYDATMTTLGYEQIMVIDNAEYRMAAYGMNGTPHFWLVGTTENTDHSSACMPPFQIGLRAPSVEAIAAWHTACLQHGAQEVNAPEHQPQLHPGYYSARVIDPNGVQIEAVLHTYNQ